MSSQEAALLPSCPPSPGRPWPQGESQKGSPGLDCFQSAKSVGERFSEVSKLHSPSAASSAEPTAQGLSLQYVCPQLRKLRVSK
jgi:hypothetical protein